MHSQYFSLLLFHIHPNYFFYFLGFNFPHIVDYKKKSWILHILLTIFLKD